MTDLYSEWRDFYAKRVSSWMSLEELRAECGRLYTVDAPSVELLLIHAMHALEEREQRDEALLRALRLADDAAESVICTEGEIRRPGVWRITREVLDADRAYLSDCLQHLAWRQMADVAVDHNTGDVIVTFRGEHPADSESTPALSTEQWRSD